MGGITPQQTERVLGKLGLMPYIAKVAVDQREKLSVFGGDFLTPPDGKGII